MLGENGNFPETPLFLCGFVKFLLKNRAISMINISIAQGKCYFYRTDKNNRLK